MLTSLEIAIIKQAVYNALLKIPYKTEEFFGMKEQI